MKTKTETRRIGAGRVLMAALCLLMTFFFFNEARADANWMENGSVRYIYISEDKDLQNYIDDDGIFASQDQINDANNGYGDRYKIVLDESGEIVVCALNSYSHLGHCSFHLYSDASLTNEIGEARCKTSGREVYDHFALDAGTYYYRIARHEYSRSHTSSVSTVFIGFIPNNRVSAAENPGSQEIKNRVDYTQVDYAIVKGDEELARLIHNDLKASSIDDLKKDVNGRFSPVRQIVINEPGDLIFAPIVRGAINNSNIHWKVFSDSGLTSAIAEIKGIPNTSSAFYHVSVEPGIYYYYDYNSIHAYDLTAYTYIGFSPRMGTEDYNPDDIKSEFTLEETDIGRDIEIADYSSDTAFIEAIKSESPVFTQEFSKKTSKQGTLYRMHFQESGYLVFKPYGSNYAKYTLYNNGSLSSIIATDKCYKQDTDDYHYIYLDPGTYYFRIDRWNGSKMTIKTYMGFLPTSSTFSVESVELNESKTEAVVRFNVSNDDYDPNKNKAVIRIEKGLLTDRTITSESTWREGTYENVIDGTAFTAVDNGLYTARISGSNLKNYMFTFEITGIGGDDVISADETEPAAASELEPVEEDNPDETGAADETQALEETEAPKNAEEEMSLEDRVKLLEQLLDENGIDY